MRRYPLLVAFLLHCLGFLVLAAPAGAQNQNHIAAELIAADAARPGEELTLALLFHPDPGWHGYWSNPGDAGYGMRLDWKLPDSWQAGEPEYPVPQTLLISGLMNHVYERDYAVLVPVSVPQDATGIAPIEVKADWLACTDKICVPESATLTLRVKVGGETVRDPRFDEWNAALPPPLSSAAKFERTDRALRIAVPLPASLEVEDPHVFVDQQRLVDYAGGQTFARDGDWLIAELPLEGSANETGAVSGILKLNQAGTGVRFAAEPGTVPGGGTPLAGEGGLLASLPVLLGLALLGGLILNVMPCVFPILSLKALSLARAGESEAEARREGLAYTAGVILASLALGALLLLLRAGGSEIGWAFQLQEPGVVIALLALAVAITANLAGLYELPSLSFTRSGGRSSAFATGLLAAFVATPCTGPFMAAAMGAALLLPWWQGLLLFAALGLGLALPFLALGFVPPLRRMLPRPGKWMETFRRLLAIPMGLTALALLWLAWRLGGPAFAAVGLLVAGALVALLIALRRGTRTVALASVVAASLVIVLLPQVYAPPAVQEQGILPAVPYSEAALAEARASGKPVFVWFTADWCLTCKVNEQVAIERDATREAFAEAGVVAMRGDWTRRDPEITRFLTTHGVAGVPLYIWYDAEGREQILPQVLTPDTLTGLAEPT